jgi:hypothetical protein
LASTAELWALRYSEVESWSAWGGAQAAAPGSAGSVPAIYSNNGSVQNTDLVLWYIAHISSRDLVATCGPWFKLEGFAPVEEEPEDGHHHDHEHDSGHDHDHDHG